MMVDENLELKAIDTMQEVQDIGEDEIIRQVAEEEGMNYEEVKEIWDAFKSEAKNVKRKKSVTKTKVDKVKKKTKNKQAKASRKRNR